MIGFRRAPAPSEPPPEPAPPPAEPQPITVAASVPTATTQPARTETARRPARRAQGQPRDTWLDRLIAESFLLALAGVGWGINALFTVVALLLVGVPWPLSVLIHLGISRAEVYLWHRWRDPAYLLPLLGCLGFDIGSTLRGSLQEIGARAPGLLGDVPQSLRAWAALLQWPLPGWWPNALALVALSSALGIGSELFMKKYWSGLRQTWRERFA